ncbi:hypothetical protein [Aquimarina aquimarini]|uniref:hypothetical protein n=1 Tax=Aquimarina aquimarini TaxID=1191734 RepID=UPI000D54C3A9|nr:hypothetical protein [Aquimarina aquimarini]
MGIRIQFFKSKLDKELKDLIFENYSDFAKWYVDRNNASIEEFDETYGTKQLIDFFTQNKKISKDLNLLPQKIIDEMTVEYVVEYPASQSILELFGPSMKKWRYNKSTQLVLETKDHEFIKLWRYLINGRSLKNSEEFDSYTDEYKIGFLSFKEHSTLKKLILKHFGDLQEMKQKYWTDSEKKKLQNSINNPDNDTYFLSDHNPVTSGLEYVMLAINEIKTSKTDLITAIE